MGWSQGGYISAFLTTATTACAAVSVGAGISNWATYYYNTDITPFTIQYLGKDPAADPAIYQKTSPMTHILQAKTPTLIQHGENDRRVPIPNAYELRQGLEDRGVPVSMIVYKGFGHGINKPKAMRAVMRHNLEWFNHYLWKDPRRTSRIRRCRRLPAVLAALHFVTRDASAVPSVPLGRRRSRYTARHAQCLLLFIVLIVAAQPAGRVLVLEHARLVDGTGRRPSKTPVSSSKATRIATSSGGNVPIPAGAERVGLSGRTVLPGLVDMHFHIDNRPPDPKLALRQLANGVTAFRDPGQWDEYFTGLRAVIAADGLRGPRIHTAGPSHRRRTARLSQRFSRGPRRRRKHDGSPSVRLRRARRRSRSISGCRSAAQRP